MLNVELSSPPASANSALYSSHRMPNRVGKSLPEADNVKLLKEEDDPQVSCFVRAGFVPEDCAGRVKY